MNTIRAYVYFSENSNTHYYRDFKIIEKLPKVYSIDEAKSDIYSPLTDVAIKITSVELDCEQGNNDIWDYDFYKIDTFDSCDYHIDAECEDGAKSDDSYMNEMYVAIKNEEV